MKSSILVGFKNLTLQYYRKYPLRLFLCIAGVAIGVAVSTSINLTSSRAVFSFSETIETLSGTANLQLTLPQGMAAQHVSDYQFLWDYGYFSPFVEQSASINRKTVRLYGFDFIGDQRIREYGFEEILGDSSLQRIPLNGVFIPYDSPLGQIGDTLPFVINAQTYPLVIRGVIKTINGKLPPLTTVFGDISTVFPLSNRITGLDIYIDPDSIETVKTKLTEVAPLATVQTIRDRKKTTSDMFSAFQMNLQALGLIALLVSAYLVYNTMNITVVQRRQYISTFISLGAERRDILTALLLEGAFFGLTGGLLGVFLGVFLSSFSYAEVSQTLTTVFQLNDSQLGFFSLTAIVFSLIVGILFTTLAAWYPAYKGSQLPVSLGVKRGHIEYKPKYLKNSLIGSGLFVLFTVICYYLAHFFESPLTGYLGVITVIAALSLASVFVTSLFAITLRNVTKNGVLLLSAASILEHVIKVSVAISALTMALSMAGAVGIMVSSFRTTIVEWLDTNLIADVYMKSLSNESTIIGQLDTTIIQTLRSDPNIEDFLTLRRTQLLINEYPVDLVAYESSVFFKHGEFNFIEGSADDILKMSVTNGALISEVYANKKKIGKGDTLMVASTRIPIIGVYQNFSSDRGFALVDTSTYFKLFGYQHPTGISLFFKENVDHESAFLSVRKQLTDYQVDITKNSDLRENGLKVFDQTFRMTQLLQMIAFFIAILSVITTLISMILERKRDMATLLALGSRPQLLAMSLIAEALTIAVISLFLAGFGSYFLSDLLIHVINRYSFGWTIVKETPFIDLFITGVILVALSAMAAWYPVRMLKNQHLPTMLKGQYDG